MVVCSRGRGAEGSTVETMGRAVMPSDEEPEDYSPEIGLENHKI